MFFTPLSFPPCPPDLLPASFHSQTHLHFAISCSILSPPFFFTLFQREAGIHIFFPNTPVTPAGGQEHIRGRCEAPPVRGMSSMKSGWLCIHAGDRAGAPGPYLLSAPKGGTTEAQNTLQLLVFCIPCWFPVRPMRDTVRYDRVQWRAQTNLAGLGPE